MKSLDQIEQTYGFQWKFETAQYTVGFWAEEEDMSPEDCFEFPEDIAFASDGGLAHWFCAFIGVFVNKTGQCVAWDVLGGCSYNSFEEFAGNRTGWRKGARLQTGGYFPDMVREAVRQARARFAD